MGVRMAKDPKTSSKGKVGFAGNRAPLGGFGLKMMQAIKSLGKDAYGARIEAWLADAGQEVDQGQVYVTGKRLEERGLVTTTTAPNKERGGAYKVKVYAITSNREQAITDSVSAYDALRLFSQAQAKKKVKD